MGKPVLWSYPDSTYNWKVCLSLFELHYAFEYRITNVFDKSQPLLQEFLKISVDFKKFPNLRRWLDQIRA